MFKTIIASALLAVAATAHAASYDAFASFGVAGSPFTFGAGPNSSGFAASPDFAADNCVGFAGLACYDNNANPYTFPAVGKNISTSNPLTFATNVLPKNELFVQSLPGDLAIVRFTAPTTSAYTVSSTFTRIDTSDGAGDGTVVGFHVVGVLNSGSSADLAKVYLTSASFSRTILLTAGESVDFTVDAKGNTFNDGTGFNATLTTVPEPASWGLMVAGFALIGAAARRRPVTRAVTA